MTMTDRTTEMLALADRIDQAVARLNKTRRSIGYSRDDQVALAMLVYSNSPAVVTALRAYAGAYVSGQRDMQERAKAVAEDITWTLPIYASEENINVAVGEAANIVTRQVASAIASLPLEAQESDNTMLHFANVLYFLADVHPDDRNDAINNAAAFFNAKMPHCKVEYSGTGYLRIIGDPVVPAPSPDSASAVRDALVAQLDVSRRLMERLKFTAQEISDCTSQARNALVASCGTCDGRGEVGGFVGSIGSGGEGYQVDPCPECDALDGGDR